MMKKSMNRRRVGSSHRRTPGPPFYFGSIESYQRWTGISQLILSPAPKKSNVWTVSNFAFFSLSVLGLCASVSSINILFVEWFVQMVC